MAVSTEEKQKSKLRIWGLGQAEEIAPSAGRSPRFYPQHHIASSLHTSPSNNVGCDPPSLKRINFFQVGSLFRRMRVNHRIKVNINRTIQYQEKEWSENKDQ